MGYRPVAEKSVFSVCSPVHQLIGKISMETAKLAENLTTFVEAVKKAKPAAAKGIYIRSVTLKSTMGPGVHIDPLLARHIDEELAATA